MSATAVTWECPACKRGGEVDVFAQTLDAFFHRVEAQVYAVHGLTDCPSTTIEVRIPATIKTSRAALIARVDGFTGD